MGDIYVILMNLKCGTYTSVVLVIATTLRRFSDLDSDMMASAFSILMSSIIHTPGVVGSTKWHNTP